MVKIQDIYGKDYDIPDLESFVSHIKKYHTINGIPDDSVHEENGYYFIVNQEFLKVLNNIS
tara:strand:+ start:176 stop:358 length:183 start_codon:yes stop_codon:yes gene_type:complete